jgi:hypothetical protein
MSEGGRQILVWALRLCALLSAAYLVVIVVELVDFFRQLNGSWIAPPLGGVIFVAVLPLLSLVICLLLSERVFKRAGMRAGLNNEF